MLGILLTLATMTDNGCPTCPRAAAPTCHALCQCAFPGHCGHVGCACKVVAGLRRPPADRWVPFRANPAYEVYGREVDGVFRYTHVRRKTPAQAATFVVCRYCGQTQFLIRQHQQCSRCGMFLQKLGLSAPACANGRCVR